MQVLHGQWHRILSILSGYSVLGSVIIDYGVVMLIQILVLRQLIDEFVAVVQVHFCRSYRRTNTPLLPTLTERNLMPIHG